ncbi:MAG: isoprenylcysteine carboxyl methyltransferase family protein [Pseudomonadota bacterium]|nr:isoprenylcysteine carboxyl methyltransferase family protein [Pseudomonadota bacterium]
MVTAIAPTVAGFLAIMALVGVERLAELVVTKRNAAWSLAHGGIEHGRGHYPVMVVLHTAFLFGALAEVLLLDRPFVPWIGVPCLVAAVGSQGLRWWVITTLGRRWNTRVIVIPGLAPIEGGPFRWLRHPNYLAVVTEGIALPMIHGAWITALVFTVLNALLLRERVRVEDQALGRTA